MPRNVLVTGASSGIGMALALRYAGERGTLALLGRNQGRLDHAAGECRKLGAEVRTGLIDVRDRAGMARWIEAFDRDFPVDLVIANAGVMAGTTPDGAIEPSDQAYQLIETNILGVLNTLHPLIPRMTSRGRGQIAIVSSIAAFAPLPDCPSYSASKSAVLTYGLALRGLLAGRGIDVSVVCPGYVTTPMMLRESGSKPFVMAPDKAADLIHRELLRNRAVISFPFFFALVTRLAGLLPDRLRRWMLLRSRFTVSD